MVNVEFIQMISMIMVTAAMILMSMKKPVPSFIIGTLAQVSWICYAYLTLQFWLGIQSVFLLGISIWGLIAWRKDERRSGQNSVSKMPWCKVHLEEV